MGLSPELDPILSFAPTPSNPNLGKTPFEVFEGETRLYSYWGPMQGTIPSGTLFVLKSERLSVPGHP